MLIMEDYKKSNGSYKKQFDLINFFDNMYLTADSLIEINNIITD